MKIALLLTILFASLATAAAGGLGSFGATSKAGKSLLSMSRRLNEDAEEANQQYLAQFSIVYAGCHNTTSWTDEGIQNMGLVRYFLCPSPYCSSSSGCGIDAYGEYVVEMQVFLESYMQWKEENNRYKCENLQAACGCDGDNDDCMSNCNYNSKWYYNNCYENEGDDKEEEENNFECARVEAKDDNNRRRLDQNDPEYFMGPYCSADGVNIYNTMFSDEECNAPISGANSLYYSITGKAMKYRHYTYYRYGSGRVSSSGILSHECISCMQPKEQQDDDDKQQEDELIEMCQETYEVAAKCESYAMGLYYTTQTGCNYISQLKKYSLGYAFAGFASSSGFSMSMMTSIGLFCVVAGLTLAATFWYKKQSK